MHTVNHLSHFVISRQLRPLLQQNSPSRIIFVSSICYDWYPLDFSDLQATNYGDAYLQYSRSKLMNHMTAFRLAREKSDGVTVNVLEPGVCETKLLKRGGYSGGPVKDGSVAPVHLVMSEEVKNITGGYFNNRGKRITSLSADSTDAKQQDRLWTMSEEICSKFGITF
nr:CBN-DHS-17 protein [Haemonchus contortus]CDJ90152.1 oxidoreductase, short chain [Haemonchus contortus]